MPQLSAVPTVIQALTMRQNWTKLDKIKYFQPVIQVETG